MDNHNLGKQTGVALFISLVMLLVLTIIGVSAVQTTSLEERMARNSRDRLMAFQAAESALRDAEAYIETITSTAEFSDGGAGGLWTIAPFSAIERWQQPDVWVGSSSMVAANAIQGVVAPPRFLIEHAATLIREENAYQIDDPYTGSVSDRIEVFRITARGVGGTENARVLLQSTYGRILE